MRLVIATNIDQMVVAQGRHCHDNKGGKCHSGTHTEIPSLIVSMIVVSCGGTLASIANVIVWIIVTIGTAILGGVKAGEKVSAKPTRLLLVWFVEQDRSAVALDTNVTDDH